MKTIRISLFVLFLGIVLIVPGSTALAQSTTPPIPPAPTDGSYVLDQLDWLTPDQEKEINAMVSKLDSENLAEIAVVTQNDCGDDTQDYRNTFFSTWGIGHKDRNDGLLILVCWFNGDKNLRKIEQETGNAMEATIPDLLTSKVVDQYFKPAFSQDKDVAKIISDGDAGSALVAMVKAYDGIIRGATPEELKQSENTTSAGMVILYIFLGFIVLLVVVLIIGVIVGGLGGGFSSGGGSYYSSDSSSGGDSGSSFGGGDSSGGGSSSSF